MMKRISAYLLFLFSCQALAINEWFELYNNTRSLGMGGAGVAVTSDDTSLYRNPANLGSIRDVYGTVFDPELEGSSNFVQQVTAGSTSKAFELEEINSILQTNRDKYYHAKLQVSPSLVRRNVGFGLIYKNDVSAITEATGTTMNVKYQSDMAVVFGANLRLFDGRVKLGANIKGLNRIEVDNPVLPTAGSMDLAVIGSEGTGFSIDGGLLIQMPWTFLPTLGAVVHDLGDTTFDKQDGFRMRANSRPATIKQSVDVAVALFPIHSNSVRSVWTLEYSDVTNSRNDTDQMKKAHFGMEINSRDIFFFRLGYNQRYWTAGFEIASERVTWQVSSYGEEIGTDVAPLEDRRLNTKFTVRF